MIWPFRRRARPAAPRVTVVVPVDGETWRVGDVAECVAGGAWSNLLGEPTSGRCPALGSRSIVTGVGAWGPLTYLRLLGYSDAWASANFRKIVVPGVEAAADDRAPAPTREAA